MKIKIQSEFLGEDIVQAFAAKLVENGVTPALFENMKIFVFSDKAGKEVEVAVDKIKVVFTKE